MDGRWRVWAIVGYLTLAACSTPAPAGAPAPSAARVAAPATADAGAPPDDVTTPPCATPGEAGRPLVIGVIASDDLTKTRGGFCRFSRADAINRGTAFSFAVSCLARDAAGDDSIVIRLWTPSEIAEA